MRKRKNQLVIPCKDGWAIRGEGNSRNTKIYLERSDAIFFARLTAERNNRKIIVYDEDGKIDFSELVKRNSITNERHSLLLHEE